MNNQKEGSLALLANIASQISEPQEQNILPKFDLKIVDGKTRVDKKSGGNMVQKGESVTLQLSEERISGEFLLILRHQNLEVRNEAIAIYPVDFQCIQKWNFPIQADTENAKTQYQEVLIPQQGIHLAAKIELKQENKVQLKFLVNNSCLKNKGHNFANRNVL